MMIIAIFLRIPIFFVLKSQGTMNAWLVKKPKPSGDQNQSNPNVENNENNQAVASSTNIQQNGASNEPVESSNNIILMTTFYFLLKLMISKIIQIHSQMKMILAFILIRNAQMKRSIDC